MNCVLLKMGGSGTRCGQEFPKQFVDICGKPLFVHVLEMYGEVECIDCFIIVTNPDWLDYTQNEAEKILGNKLIGVVGGGTTNLKSTYNGFLLATEFLHDEDILLVHDVTDPIICANAIKECILACKEYGCAAVITEQVHTLYMKDEYGFVTSTISKNSVGSGYSPEAFKMHIIKKCFAEVSDENLNKMTSAISIAIASGVKPKAVISHQLDIKVTYKEDIESLRVFFMDRCIPLT